MLLQKEVNFDPASCPLDIEPDPAAGAGAAQEDSSSGSLPASFLIFFPERLPTELLHWLGQSFPGGAARLEFPASLSKAERARWHQAAERLRLHGQSVGVGESRFLTIGTAPPSGIEGADAAGSRSGRAPLSREQRERARIIWNACQMEGGKHWERRCGGRGGCSHGSRQRLCMPASNPCDSLAARHLSMSPIHAGPWPVQPGRGGSLGGVGAGAAGRLAGVGRPQVGSGGQAGRATRRGGAGGSCLAGEAGCRARGACLQKAVVNSLLAKQPAHVAPPFTGCAVRRCTAC